MPKSIRQQIFEAVGSRLAAINGTGDYQTTIGDRKTSWNVTPITDREIDGIDLRDVDETTTDEVTRHQDHVLIINAEIHAKKGAETAQFLRKALGDVITAIGVDRRWGGLARHTTTRGNQMIIDQTDKVVGGIRIVLAITYRTLTLDPYNQ